MSKCGVDSPSPSLLPSVGPSRIRDEVGSCSHGTKCRGARLGVRGLSEICRGSLLLVLFPASIYLIGAGRGSWAVLLWCDAQNDVIGQAAGEDEPAFLLSGRRLGRSEFMREDNTGSVVYMVLIFIRVNRSYSYTITEQSNRDSRSASKASEFSRIHPSAPPQTNYLDAGN